MSESAVSREQEPQPQLVTGLFRLGIRNPILERDISGKVMPAGKEPLFAVNDVELAFTKDGWQDFAERLVVHLEGVEADLYRGSAVYAVEIAEMPVLTNDLDPGEVRRISDEDYHRAYLEKFGRGIIGPLFL